MKKRAIVVADPEHQLLQKAEENRKLKQQINDLTEANKK
jgi:hypothetical protein